jgi:hypothetical protein
MKQTQVGLILILLYERNTLRVEVRVSHVSPKIGRDMGHPWFAAETETAGLAPAVG